MQEATIERSFQQWKDQVITQYPRHLRCQRQLVLQVFSRMSQEERDIWLQYGEFGVLVPVARFGKDFDLILKHPQVIKKIWYKSKQYFLPGGETADLRQFCLIGLWEAIRNYNPYKGLDFLKFAEICMERQVITAIATATRQKRQILNTAVKFDAIGDPDNMDDWQDSPLTHDGRIRFAEDGAIIDFTQEAELEALEEAMRCSSRVNGNSLSSLEKRVVILKAVGYSYKEMADKLERSEKSIDCALARVRKKLGQKPKKHKLKSKPTFEEMLQAPLSLKQREVVELLQSGKTLCEIASMWGTKRQHVQSYVNGAREKARKYHDRS